MQPVLVCGPYPSLHLTAIFVDSYCVYGRFPLHTRSASSYAHTHLFTIHTSIVSASIITSFLIQQFIYILNRYICVESRHISRRSVVASLPPIPHDHRIVLVPGMLCKPPSSMLVKEIKMDCEVAVSNQRREVQHGMEHIQKIVDETSAIPVPSLLLIRRVPRRCYRLLPLWFMQRYRCIVIGKASDALTLAVTDLHNTDKLTIVQELTGCHALFPVMVSERQMRLLLRRIERAVKREQPQELEPWRVREKPELYPSVQTIIQFLTHNSRELYRKEDR